MFGRFLDQLRCVLHKIFVTPEEHMILIWNLNPMDKVTKTNMMTSKTPIMIPWCQNMTSYWFIYLYTFTRFCFPSFLIQLASLSFQVANYWIPYVGSLYLIETFVFYLLEYTQVKRGQIYHKFKFFSAHGVISDFPKHRNISLFYSRY